VFLTIHPPFNTTMRDFDDTVHLSDCIIAFTQVVDNCNRGFGNVTSSGSFIEPACHWLYEVDLEPLVPIAGTGPRQAAPEETAGAKYEIEERSIDGFDKRHVFADRVSEPKRSVPQGLGNSLTCATETHAHVNRSTALETINWFCHGNAGHQFPSNGSEEVLFSKVILKPRSRTSADFNGTAWYYNLDSEADKHTPVGLGVHQAAGSRSPTCTYRLDLQQCVAQLTTAVNSCNDNKDDVTLSAAIKDADCGWLLAFDLEPGVAPLAIGHDAVTSHAASSKQGRRDGGTAM